MASRACKHIRKATKGFGTDDETVKATLHGLDETELSVLHTMYEAEFGKKLLDVLGSEYRGNLERAVQYQSLGRFGRLALLIRKATEGAGTDEKALSTAICTLDHEDKGSVYRAYFQLFGEDIRDDVMDDVDNNAVLTQVFTTVFSVKRGYMPAAIPAQVDRLYRAKKKGRKTAFVEIFSTCTRKHIHELTEAWKVAHGTTLIKEIKDLFSGDEEYCLLSLADDPSEVWARFAFKSDKALIAVASIRPTKEVSDAIARESGNTLKGLLSDEVGEDTFEMVNLP